MTAAQEEALNIISSEGEDNIFLNINGAFGSGKSFLCEKYIDKFSEKELILSLKDFDGDLIPEIYAYLLSQITQPSKDKFIETFYNLSRTKEILQEYKSIENFDQLLDITTLRDNYQHYFSNDSEKQNLKNNIEKEDTRKFLENLKVLCLESFFVDIFHFFLINNLDEKATITIIIDDNDNIIDSIQDYFILPLQNLIISQFNFNFFDAEEIKKSGIIDKLNFKLIVFSRKNIENNFDSIELQYPDKNEVIEILASQDISVSKAEDFAGLSGGNLQLLELITLHNVVNKADLLALNLKYLFKFFTEREILLLSPASYLNEFEANALKIFNVQTQPNRDFEYLRSRKEYFTESNNHIKLKNNYKELIRETIRITDESTHSELTELSETYQAVLPIIQKYGSSNFEMLRHLAYFKRFDTSEVLFKLFNTSNKSEFKNIENYKIIEKSEFTFRIKDDHREVLLNFNKKADKQSFNDKIEIVKRIWTEQNHELKKARNDYTKELDLINKEIKSINKEINNYENKIDKIKKELIETEQRILEIKSKQKIFEHKQPVILTLSLSLISIVALFIGVFGEVIFDSESIYLLVSLILGIILLAYNFLPIRRIIIRQKQKDEIKRNIKEIEKLNAINQELSKSSNIIKADIKASNYKQKELEKDIDNYRSSLNKIEKKLNESFID